MNKLFIGFFSMLPCICFGWEPSIIHQHSVKWSGVLPEPYKTIDIEISLNPENDDLQHFVATVGENVVRLNPDQISKLKDLELGTMQMTHEIYGEEGMQDTFKDWIYIHIEQGDMRRIERKENGKTEYVWGRNVAEIIIVYGKRACVNIVEFGKPRVIVLDCESNKESIF